jgi:hypothetical protein
MSRPPFADAFVVVLLQTPVERKHWYASAKPCGQLTAFLCCCSQRLARPVSLGYTAARHWCETENASRLGWFRAFETLGATGLNPSETKSSFRLCAAADTHPRRARRGRWREITEDWPRKAGAASFAGARRRRVAPTGPATQGALVRASLPPVLALRPHLGKGAGGRRAHRHPASPTV